MRFKKRPQLPGAGRTRAGHHDGSHTPTNPRAILLSKMAPGEVGLFHDDATPLSFQFQVTEDFFKSHNFFIMKK